MELLKETYLDAYLEYFKKTKKEFRTSKLIYGFVFFFIFALGFLVVGEYKYLLLTPIAFFIGYKLPYYNLMSTKKKNDLITSFLFPQFLQSFMGLLASSGNIYQTLKLTVDYVNDPLKSELERLVARIEKDNKREYYLEFAETINNSEAYMIMDIIYQFSEYGVKKDTLDNLKNYIQRLDENKVNELIDRKLLSAEKYGYIGIFIGMFFVLGYTGTIMAYYLQDVIKALEVL